MYNRFRLFLSTLFVVALTLFNLPHTELQVLLAQVEPQSQTADSLSINAPTLNHHLFIPLLTNLSDSESDRPAQATPNSNANIHTQDDYSLAELARQRNEPRFQVDEAQAAATGPLNQVGQWGPVVSWPFAFASAASLPDGRIAAWGANNLRSFNGGNFTYASVWDPATGQFLTRNHNDHPMFCAIPTMMEDGRVFVNGGDADSNKTSIFDYRTNQWTRTDNMSTGRWYPGSVMLPGDKLFTMLGRPGGSYPEVWTEGNGWSLLTGANLNNGVLNYSGYQSTWLPYVHLMPNGNVFHSGPTTQMNTINPNGNGSISSAGLTNSWYPKYSVSIMYDKGKILVAGGAANNSSSSAATNNAMLLDVNGSSPTKTNIASMAYARQFANGVVLPNGEVIVVGGNTTGQEFSDQGSILPAEIWNPDTQAWREVANMSVPRNYHSVALLMTDGRVWSGGGGLCNCNADHMDHQIYSPPYLFNSNGSLATRPSISSAPDVVTYGSTISVQASSGIQQFSMIKVSATTHHMNSDLRFLDVPFSGSNGQYQLTLESNSNVLTPGFWMLFALNSQGTPSIAKVFNVSSTAPPPPGTGSGQILREWWTGVGGTAIGDLTSSPNYPDNPTGSNLLSQFEAPTDFADNYGTRVRGYIHPPISGQYRFWISSDDNGQLLLSSDESPANATQIASVPAWSSPRQWGKYSQQQSGLISLQAGQKYYIEALQKEGSGLDNLAVAWQIPGSALAVIDGQYLSPYQLNQSPSLSNPGNQASQEGESINLAMSANDPEGDPLTFSATGLPPGLSINSNSGAIAGEPSIGSAGTYNSTVTVSDGSSSASTAFTWIVTDPNTTIIQYNFESQHGWVTNPSGTDTATTGQWERTNPAGTSSNGTALQLNTTASGQNALVTEGAAGSSAGTNDIDNGRTSIRSPNITIPSGSEASVSFAYYLAHLDNATSEDYLRVSVVGASTTQIFQELGAGNLDAASWETFNTNLNSYAGQTVYLLVEAADGGSGSLVEAAIDDVVFTFTITNQSPVLSAPSNQNSTEGENINLAVSASDPDGDTLSFSANGLPNGLSINSSGVIAGTLPSSSAGTYNSTVTVNDGNGGSDSTNFSWTVQAAPALALDPIVSPPQEQNTSAGYTASFSGGLNPRFKWLFGDGTPETGYTSSPSVAHTYTQPGRYIVTLTGTDDTGQEVTEQFAQLVHRPLTVQRPSISMSIVYEERAGNDRIWNVNPDNNTVTVSNASTQQKITEIAVGSAPRALAIAPNGRVWVTNKHDASVSIIDPASLNVVQTVSLPVASQPYGIAFAPDDSSAFVTLEATGILVKLDPVNGSQIGSVNVGPTPRHISVLANSNSVYVSRFISPPTPGEETGNPQLTSGGGEVVVVNASAMNVVQTISLQYSDRPDTEGGGRGTPNYLGPAVISPDGGAAWVPSKQDNIARGALRDGQALDHDHTVRSVTSYLNLGTNQEQFVNRIDHDNGGIASSGQFGRYGAFLFVALEGSREVAVVDAYAQSELFRIDVGRAPQGVAVSSDGSTLYVHNFMDRSIGVYNLSGLLNEGVASAPEMATINAVDNELLSAQVLQGKQLFYDAKDTRLALDSYISCASCHNDGGEDGRVWDLTSLGEGLRNTIDLNGRSGMGQGPLHWSANFDEVQDFENQIRDLAGGTGLMSNSDFAATQDPLGIPKAGFSADLDALAAYVGSLTTGAASPHRNSDGSLTTNGTAGRTVFENNGCATCHTGQGYTDSTPSNLHDIGTLTPASGSRLGGQLTGIDTPTLRGIWSSAPYLHDGSAVTLEEAVNAHSGVSISANDLNKLVSFLRQIDDTEPAPNNNTSPVLTNPGSQTNTVGDAVSLTIGASDADNDPLTFGATNLPGGLVINSASGSINGTTNTTGSFEVSITVDDGNGGTDSISFTWVISAPANNPPEISIPSNQANTVGEAINLTLSATDLDGDTLTFDATGLPDGLSIDNSSGLIAGTVTTAGSFNINVSVDDGNGGSDSSTFSWTVSPGSAGCGGLVQEAESGTIFGNFAVGIDGAASNSTYIHVPEGSGNSAFGSTSRAEYCFTVTEAGTYRLVGSVYAIDGASDSFFVTVDGQPASGYVWKVLRNTLYANDYVSDNGAVVDLSLTVGDHSVVVYLREDGTRLDRLSLELDSGNSNNTAPNLTSPGDQISTVGASVTLPITANDPDGDPLVYSATGLPTGLTLNSTTGQISGSPTVAGTANVALSVSDGRGGTDSASFNWIINSDSSGCGSLGQEAEAGDLFGNFVVDNDPAASGGSYIHVPNGTGNASFGSASRAIYCFTVAQAGTYRLVGAVHSADGGSDSFFAAVNGQPSGGYLWDSLRNTQYANDYVSDRNGADPVELSLAAGEHTIVIYLREDGARLDRLTLELVGSGPVNAAPVLTNPGSQTNTVGDTVALPLNASDADNDPLTFSASGLPSGLSINNASAQIEGNVSTAGSYAVNLSVTDGQGGVDSVNFNWVVTDDTTGCGGLAQEAEAGQLFGNFATAADPAASGGTYIHVPDGTGNANFGSVSRAVYCFNVDTAGTYRLRAQVYGADGGSDSFFATVNGIPTGGYLWDILRNTQYQSDYLSDRNGSGPVELNLSTGEHTVTVYLREDGARLDTLELESTVQALAASYRPALLGQPLATRGLMGSVAGTTVTQHAAPNPAFANLPIKLVDAETGGDLYEQSQQTDANGEFFFDATPVGSYLLQVTYDGELLEEPITLTDEEMIELSLGLQATESSGGVNGSQGPLFIFLPVTSN